MPIKFFKSRFQPYSFKKVLLLIFYILITIDILLFVYALFVADLF